MEATTIILILLSSIGFLMSGFYSLYLLIIKRKADCHNIFLGGLILVLSIRIAKSVFYNFTDLPLVIKNMGLAANLAIGPFLFMYLRAIFHQRQWQPKDLWHFLPAAVYVLFSGQIPNELGNSYWYASYTLVIIQQMLYLIIALQKIPNWRSTWRKQDQREGIILWLAISFIWLIYLFIFLGVLPIYIFGALAYSTLVLLLGYYIIVEEEAAAHTIKYGPQRLSSVQSKQYLERLHLVMETEKSFLNPKLSIQDVSNRLDVSSKIVSQVINNQLKLNFSAFINNYRIEEVKSRLIDKEYQSYTIASIAYDCGFNSISSFNTTFKALTNQTPSQFRKAFQKSMA